MYSIIQGVLNNQGANEMENLGIEFTYPKPSLLLKKIINSVPDKNIKILDFMAGSGTTGHAVMELNKEDGGSRQYILCTNNENNICEEVTYERLKRVIKGYKNKKGEQVEGLGGNLEYLKCEYIDKTRHTDNMKMRLMRACTEMLCLKENTFELDQEVKDGETLIYRIYNGIKINKDGNKEKQYVGIYYDLDDSYIDDMRGDLKKHENAHKTAYIFSLRNVADYIDDYRKWRGINIEEVPQKILEIYETIYKRNSRN
jgi:adenine-specific DNA-methyltransferase